MEINKKSNIKLDRILGLNVSSSTGISIHPSTSIIAYPAGATLVLFNHRKQTKQAYQFLTCNRISKSNKSTTPIKSISAVSFSSCGQFVAFAESGHQPKIIIVELSNNRILAELPGHKFGVLAVSFSPDSKYLVSIGVQHDGNMFVWNLKTFAKIGIVRLNVKLHAIAFDPSGEYFVTSGVRHVKFWYMNQFTNPKPKASAQTKLPTTPQIEGKYAILGGHKNSVFIDIVCYLSPITHQKKTYSITENGELILFNERLLESWVNLNVKHGYSISVCDRFVVCGCSDGIVRLFDPDTLIHINTLPRPHYLGMDVGLSVGSLYKNTAGIPDAVYPNAIAVKIDHTMHKLVVVYDDRSIYVWEVKDTRQIGKCKSMLYHSDCVWGVEMLPTAKNLDNPISLNKTIPPNSFVTYSSDGSIRFWNLNDLERTPRNIYSKDLIKIISPALPKKEETVGIRSLKVSCDGKLLVSGDKVGNIRVHELTNFTQIHFVAAHEAEILSIDFSLKNENNPVSTNLIATASRDRLIHIFDVNDSFALVQTINDHSSSITACKFSDNGLRLMSCAADKSIIFRKLDKLENPTETGYQYATYHTSTSNSTVYDMEIDVTQRFIATVSQSRMNMFSVQSGKPARSYKPDLECGFIKIAIDPSGLFLATVGTDKVIRIHDFYSGACVGSFSGHSELITGVTFTGDGERIITTSGDGCVFVWKLNNYLVQQIKQRLVELDSTTDIPENEEIVTKTTQEKAGFLDQVDGVSTLEPNNKQLPTSNILSPTHSPITSPGFVFSYRESVLPLWARQKDENNIIGNVELEELEPKRSRVPLPTGLWASRVGAKGVTLYSESAEIENPIAFYQPNPRRYSFDETENQVIIVQNIEQETPKNDSSANTSLDEDDIITKDETIMFFDNPLESKVFKVEAETKDLSHSKSSEELMKREENEGVESIVEDPDDDDDVGTLRKEFGAQTFQEFINDPVNIKPVIDVRKSMTAQHILDSTDGHGLKGIRTLSPQAKEAVDDGLTEEESGLSTPMEMGSTEGSFVDDFNKSDDEESDISLLQKLSSISKLVTTKITTETNPDTTENIKNNVEMYQILVQVAEDTAKSIRALEVDIGLREGQGEKVFKLMDLVKENGELKDILTVYSRLLVEAVRDSRLEDKK